jgi:putative sigma-54 modulation protein
MKGVTMNVEISARHFELTDSLREHVDEKLSVLDKFYDGIDDVHVVLELSSGMSRSHVQLRGDRLRLDSRAQEHDMYFSFDDCISSLERQLRKFKETHHDHPHRENNGKNPVSGAWYIAAEPSELAAPVLVEDAAVLKKYSTNDAMTEFEVNGDDGNLIFYNTETNSFSAAYRTSSGATQVVELTRKE